MQSSHSIYAPGVGIAVGIAGLTPYMTNTNAGWMITSIHVLVDYRRRGYGSQLLRQICQAADAEDLPLYLEVAATDPSGMSFEALHIWYCSFGFVGPAHSVLRRRKLSSRLIRGIPHEAKTDPTRS